MDEDPVVIATRVTKNAATLIDKLLKIDGYLNRSDFLRDAVREKLEREIQNNAVPIPPAKKVKK
jgi:metal-responsive CopG/Arc/MetJ family transcriptional regulator